MTAKTPVTGEETKTENVGDPNTGRPVAGGTMPEGPKTTISAIESVIFQMTGGNLEVAFGVCGVIMERMRQRYNVAYIQPMIIAEMEAWNHAQDNLQKPQDAATKQQ